MFQGSSNDVQDEISNEESVESQSPKFLKIFDQKAIVWCILTFCLFSRTTSTAKLPRMSSYYFYRVKIRFCTLSQSLISQKFNLWQDFAHRDHLQVFISQPTHNCVLWESLQSLQWITKLRVTQPRHSNRNPPISTIFCRVLESSNNCCSAQGFKGLQSSSKTSKSQNRTTILRRWPSQKQIVTDFSLKMNVQSHFSDVCQEKCMKETPTNGHRNLIRFSGAVRPTSVDFPHKKFKNLVLLVRNLWRQKFRQASEIPLPSAQLGRSGFFFVETQKRRIWSRLECQKFTFSCCMAYCIRWVRKAFDSFFEPFCSLRAQNHWSWKMKFSKIHWPDDRLEKSAGRFFQSSDAMLHLTSPHHFNRG